MNDRDDDDDDDDDSSLLDLYLRALKDEEIRRVEHMERLVYAKENPWPAELTGLGNVRD